MNELLVENEIGNRIFLLRGKEVMLDRDLAELYGVETKSLKFCGRKIRPQNLPKPE